jgi:HEPN domain-containing protein
MSRETEFAVKWLRKASHDLVTARQTLLLEDCPTDTISFHAQQAIEKSLKAILTFLNIEFPRTHDLVLLMNLLSNTEYNFESFKRDFAEISGYSVSTRYPDDFFEPSRDDAEYAFQVSLEIYKKCDSIIQNKLFDK